MRWMMLALALAACGGKKESPAAGSGSGSPVAATATDAATAAPALDAAGAPAKRTITKQIRAEYKQYLNKGRAAAKAAQWPEALAALNSALAAIPGDDRALAELSFAAMSAGDFDTARKAGRQAVLAATDPKIKAAALYNLGRVEETDAPAKALELYRQSIALRPSKIVDKRLAELSSRVTFTPDPLPCTAPASPDAVCACLNKRTEVDPAVQECSVASTALADFQLAHVKTSDIGEEDVFLLGKSDAGWAVVAVLDSVYNPGAFGISEDWELAEAADQRYGTHSTARFVAHKSRHDSDMGIDEEESEDTTELTVCVRDNTGGLPACPLQVTTGYTYVRDRMGMATDDELADLAESRTTGLPIRSETKVAVEIGDDGVAKIRAVSGRPEAGTLGDRKLW